MSLEIGFIHHIQTILITQIIYIRIIRIMAGPDGIEVELLHQSEVRLHFSPRYALAAEFTMVMPVHAIKLDRHTVDKQLLILYLNIAETDPAAAGSDH